MPSAPARAVRTWSPWAREYARDPERYVFGTAPSDWALEIARLVRPGDTVLDLGCGEGRDSVFFAELGATVTGVDLSADGLDKARRLARGRGVRVRWIEGATNRGAPGGPLRPDLLVRQHPLRAAGRAATRCSARLAAMTRPGWAPGARCCSSRARSGVSKEKGEIVDYFTAGKLREAFVEWQAS